MKCCGACTAIVLKAARVEEKSGPGAIFGKYRCAICWKGFDVRDDHPHNLNTAGNDYETVQNARAALGIAIPCPLCEREADEKAGKAIKANIVFHNCGKPNP